MCIRDSFYTGIGKEQPELKQDDAKKIINIALAGHSGAGKTSVAEAMLYFCLLYTSRCV